MEDCASIASSFCSHIRSFCASLESSCSSLRTAVDQRPSSFPSSNLPSFLTTLHDRVFSTSQAVENLEAMTVGTISFEELLGHSMELYRQNEMSICTLEERLKQYGYKPEEIWHGNVDDRCNNTLVTAFHAVNLNSRAAGLSSSEVVENQPAEEMIRTVTEAQEALLLSSFAGDSEQDQSVGTPQDDRYAGLDKDPGMYGSVYSNSLSLQDLGLSDAGLACLAQEESSPGIEDRPY